jgi:hypothetical protein
VWPSLHQARQDDVDGAGGGEVILLRGCERPSMPPRNKTQQENNRPMTAHWTPVVGIKDSGPQPEVVMLKMIMCGS